MKLKKIDSFFLNHSFLVIIFSALFIELIGHYHAKSFIFSKNFYYSWIILRIPLPLLILYLCKIPLKGIGLKWKRPDKKILKLLFFLILLVSLAFIFIHSFNLYFNYYSSFRGPSSNKLSRFLNFMIFTLSTLPAWEFFHRGFLLMGLTYLLKDREQISKKTSWIIAISVVWIFEVVFHFIKPETEALGMLIGSPLLSYLALRTKSIWLPFLLHFYVEILFIGSLLWCQR